MPTLAIPITPEVNIDPQSLVAEQMAVFGVKRHVISLHYRPTVARRAYRTIRGHGPSTVYRLNAVLNAADCPSVCLVLDGLENNFMGTDQMTYKKQYAERNISSLEIARDLVNEASGAPDSGPDDFTHPAIWISKASKIPAVGLDAYGNTVLSSDWNLWGSPEFVTLFPEFAAECKAYAIREWRHCERKVAEAAAFDDGPTKNPFNITDEIHRAAGRYIGVTEIEYKWMSKTKHGGAIQCPFCGKPTSPSHPKCQSCGDVINQALYDQRKREAGVIASQQLPQQPHVQK